MVLYRCGPNKQTKRNGIEHDHVACGKKTTYSSDDSICLGQHVYGAQRRHEQDFILINFISASAVIFHPGGGAVVFVDLEPEFRHGLA